MVPAVPADGGAQEPAFKNHWEHAMAQCSCSQLPLPGLRTGLHTHSHCWGLAPVCAPALKEPEAQVQSERADLSVEVLTCPSLQMLFAPVADVMWELVSLETL